jgi:hypothetical protein
MVIVSLAFLQGNSFLCRAPRNAGVGMHEAQKNAE